MRHSFHKRERSKGRGEEEEEEVGEQVITQMALPGPVTLIPRAINHPALLLPRGKN